MIVTDESTENNAEDWPKLVWIFDARDEKTSSPIATCPLPPVDAYANRGGRFGAHNIHENPPVPTAWQSDQIVIGTFFNGGLRAYDISNPYQPKEVGSLCRRHRRKARRQVRFSSTTCSWTNAASFTPVDRHTGGLYILEMDF